MHVTGLIVYYRKHRKKGHAQRLMSLLHDQLVAQGALASVLYSDVGDFYSRCTRLPNALAGGDPSGWDIEGPTQAEWPVNAVVSSDTSVDARSLKEADLDRVAILDSALLQKKVSSAERATICILPTGPGLEWRSLKSRYYEKHLTAKGKREGLPSLDQTGWGVELGSRENPATWAYALWAYDLPEKEVIILRLRCNDAEQLKTVVSKALEAARQQGMEKVTAWNLDEGLAKEAGGSMVTRKEHLPALAWYGEGSRPEWIANENWAWC